MYITSCSPDVEIYKVSDNILVTLMDVSAFLYRILLESNISLTEICATLKKGGHITL